jgi:L-threonylcarbamoyladenylate synthase
VAGDGRARVEELRRRAQRIGWLTLAAEEPEDPQVIVRTMPADAAGYAARLYAALHELDDAAVDCIVVALPPTGEDWLAIHDRLRRAERSST